MRAELAKEAKRLDLRNRPGDLRHALANPVTVAAITAALVTISSAVISSVVAEHQNNLDGHRAELQAKFELARRSAPEVRTIFLCRIYRRLS